MMLNSVNVHCAFLLDYYGQVEPLTPGSGARRDNTLVQFLFYTAKITKKKFYHSNIQSEKNGIF